MTATIFCSTLLRHRYPYSLWIDGILVVPDGGLWIGDYRTAKMAERRARQLGATEIKYVGH